MLDHERVLEALMAGGSAVLPCRLGTVARSAEQVRDFLRAAREALAVALRGLRGKEEAGVKAFWIREAVMREVERETGSLERLRAQAADPHLGRHVAIAVGQAVEACLERWKADLVPRIIADLRPFCAAVREGRLFSHRPVLNLALLVEREREPSLREAGYRLSDRYGDRLDFKYVAGLPPYSFVDLRISGDAPAPSGEGGPVG